MSGESAAFTPRVASPASVTMAAVPAPPASVTASPAPFSRPPAPAARPPAPVRAPVAPAAPVRPVAAPARPTRSFKNPEDAWEALKKELARGFLEDAAFLSYQGGVLVLGVRGARSKSLVESSIKDVDFAPWFTGFQSWSVREDQSGKTGRERQRELDSGRKAAAMAAARDSAAVKLFEELLGAVLDLDRVEPVALPAEAEPAVELEE